MNFVIEGRWRGFVDGEPSEEDGGAVGWYCDGWFLEMGALGGGVRRRKEEICRHGSKLNSLQEKERESWKWVPSLGLPAGAAIAQRGVTELADWRFRSPAEWCDR